MSRDSLVIDKGIDCGCFTFMPSSSSSSQREQQQEPVTPLPCSGYYPATDYIDYICSKMPPRKRPAPPQVYKDTPDATPSINAHTQEHQQLPPQKRQRRFVLGEKHNLNVGPSSDRGTSPTGKRRREGDGRDVLKMEKEGLGRGGNKKERQENRVDEKNTACKVNFEKVEKSVNEESKEKQTTSPNLTDQIVALLGPNHGLSLPSTRSPDDFAKAITARCLWSPEVLTLFQHSTLTTLRLNSPLSSSNPFFDPTPLLASFFSQNTFGQLTHLSLSFLPLNIDSVALLRLLSSLKSLDLSNTGIDNRAISNLVCHRNTLTELNLSNNPLITDDARVPLFALSALTILHLRGTSFTMPGLRRLVADLDSRPPIAHPHDPMDPLPPPPPIRSICRLSTIPISCLDALNIPPGYAVNIPPEGGYVAEARFVDNLDVKGLKRNLELHARVNKGISLQGGKVELVARLREVLEKRAGDVRLRRAVQ